MSQTQLLQPFISLIASSWWLGESLAIETVIFAALVVATVAFGKRLPVAKNETFVHEKVGGDR